MTPIEKTGYYDGFHKFPEVSKVRDEISFFVRNSEMALANPVSVILPCKVGGMFTSLCNIYFDFASVTAYEGTYFTVTARVDNSQTSSTLQSIRYELVRRVIRAENPNSMKPKIEYLAVVEDMNGVEAG